MYKTGFVIALMMVAATQGVMALEATATSKNVQENTMLETRLQTREAILTSAINKINTEQTAILECMKINRFYKPADSTADAKGCVGVEVTTDTTMQTMNLADITFATYPGARRNKKGWIGEESHSISLAPYISEGAKAISVAGVLSGFTGNCSSVVGDIAMNVSDVKTSVPTVELRCHYDGSPNRSSFLYWSYNAGSKALTVRARMSQTNQKMTSARIGSVKVRYALAKTTLKVGDGR